MEIYVYADWKGLNGSAFIGTLSVEHTKGHQVVSFAYDKAWLTKGFAQILDPDLQFFGGPQYLPKGKLNFGLFMDSLPDRWGKQLMDRRESILATNERRKAKKLFEEDYLLGVYDLYRIGGLRFKVEGSDHFQHEDKGLVTPPFSSLRELEQASLALEDDLLKDREALKWLNMLIAPGSSLGGARPKASVVDENGHPWIAKFPSLKDTYNVGAWEMVATDLALEAGLNMAEAMTRQYGSRGLTYLSKRFDREGSDRIHFASAMTLLGYTDGEAGVSYLQLAEFIMQRGAEPNQDLEELWKRIVFHIAIKNTDDHLRNHGFILTDSGWRLSPAYDINPNIYGTGLALNISETDNSLNFDLAREVSKYFRIADADAVKYIAETRRIARKWKKMADKYKIVKKEQEQMADAFE